MLILQLAQWTAWKMVEHLLGEGSKTVWSLTQASPHFMARLWPCHASYLFQLPHYYMWLYDVTTVGTVTDMVSVTTSRADQFWELHGFICHLSWMNECECKRHPEAGESTSLGALQETCRSQPLLLGGASTYQVQGKEAKIPDLITDFL